MPNETRQKIILLIALLIFLMLVGSFLFRHFEKQKLLLLVSERKLETANLLEKIISLKSKSQATMVDDYSYWDDLVTFIAGSDRFWADEMVKQALPDYGCDVAWILRPDRSLRYDAALADSFDLADLPFPLAVLDKIAPPQHPTIHFFAATRHGLVEIHGTTIHPSADKERKTRPQGFLIIGRLWDAHYLEELALFSESDVKLVAPPGEAVSAPAQPLHSLMIENNVVLPGWDNKPVMQLQSRRINNIAAKMKSQEDLQFLINLAFFILLFWFVAYFLYHYIFQPLQTIERSLSAENPETIQKLLAQKDEFGRIAGMIHDFFQQKQRLAAEIQERIRFEHELVRARDAAEAANRAKSEFLANMSHEIRTPMNSVLGFAQVLEKQPLTPAQLVMVRHIRTSGRLLLSIISDILDLSKIEAGRLELEERPFSLAEVLNHLDGLMGSAASSKGLALYIDPPEPVTDHLIGDALRLGQILLNLTSNAIKFTEKGCIHIQSRVIELDEEWARVRLEVIDSGIGIAPEVKATLFQPFNQADSSITRRFGGTGLGLVICKRLTEQMGGEIGIASRTGAGSTFYVEIRFKRTA